MSMMENLSTKPKYVSADVTPMENKRQTIAPPRAECIKLNVSYCVTCFANSALSIRHHRNNDHQRFFTGISSVFVMLLPLPLLFTGPLHDGVSRWSNRLSALVSRPNFLIA